MHPTHPRTQPSPPIPADRLRLGHPDWVRSLASAAGVATWALLLGAAAVAAETLPSAHRAAPFARVAAAACFAYAAWRLTRRDPNGSTPSSDTPLRWALRLTLPAAAAGAALQCALLTGLLPPALVPAPTFLLLVLSAADLLGRLAFLRQAQRLATRIPDPRLATRLGSLVHGYGLALAFVATFGALRTSVPMLDHLSLAAALALCIVALVVARHLRRLRRGLQIQTDYARGLWSRTPAARPEAFGLAG